LTAQNAAYRAISSTLSCSHDTLRSWCIQAARDAGERSGPSREGKARSEPLQAPLVQAQWRANWSARSKSCAPPTRS
jgi:transposase-like protein